MIQPRPIARAAALVLAATAIPAAAQQSYPTIVAEFPAGVETCYGRAYDKAHLRKHLHQRVTALYLFRSLTDDPRSEEEPRTLAENVAASIEDERYQRAEEASGNFQARTTLKVLVKFKDKREVFVQDVDCARKGDGFRCGVDCDGGSFNANLENGQLMLRVDGGLRVRSGCTSDDETAPEETIDENEDAALFRLDQMPIENCHAIRDEARPDWAKTSDETLRARFATAAGQCFVSRPGLGKQTDHEIERLALTTLDLPKPEEGDNRPSMKVRLDATLAEGRTLSRTLGCWGSGYAFQCSLEGTGNILLTRNGGKGIAVRESYYVGSEIATLLGIDRDELFPPIGLEPAEASQCAATH